MNEAAPERKRAFLRWLSLGPSKQEERARYALNAFLPILETAGFEWVEKEFDGSKPQVNSLHFERTRINGQIEYVDILFTRYRHLKFKIYARIKEEKFPHKSLKAGDLVRYKSILDRAKWWGPKWWHLNKGQIFKSDVKKVARLLPKLIDFLSTGAVAPPYC